MDELLKNPVSATPTHLRSPTGLGGGSYGLLQLMTTRQLSSLGLRPPKPERIVSLSPLPIGPLYLVVPLLFCVFNLSSQRKILIPSGKEQDTGFVPVDLVNSLTGRRLSELRDPRLIVTAAL